MKKVIKASTRLVSLFFISCIFCISVNCLGGLSLNLKLIAGCIGYFIASYYLMSSFFFPEKKWALGILTLPPALIFMLFNVFQYPTTFISLPSNLYLLFGLAAGVLYFKSKSLLVPFSLIGLMALWLTWLNKIHLNKVFYGTMTGAVSFRLPSIKLYDSTNNNYMLNNPAKLYLIDFWNSGCGVCFRQFPTVDSISKLADSSKFEVLSLNIPIRKELKEDNYAILDRFNYKFKKLYADDKSVADSFGITGFPTTIVIQNNKVLFRGDFEEAVKRFKVVD